MGTKSDRFGFWKRGRIWYTTDPVSGREGSTGFTDLTAAKAWRAKRERFAADPEAYTRQATTLGDECRRMIDALTAIGRPTRYYQGKLANWIDVLGNDFPLASVNPEAFDRFIAERRDDGVTDHTISKEIKCMITTLRFAKRAGRYGGDTDNMRPMGFSPGYVPRTRSLSIPELGRLLDALEPEGQVFVIMVVAFGLRRGEALKVQPGDLDLTTWELHVRGTKTEGALRDLPVLAPFRPLMPFVAASLPLGGWARGNYVRALEWACKRAGIAKATGNDLRRTHATLLRSAKVDPDTMRQLLGHTPGSRLLEAVYDKPNPTELAARAGDLSGLTAEVAGLADSLMRSAKHGISTEKNGLGSRPWGPLHSPTWLVAPPEVPSKPDVTGQNGSGDDEESRNLDQDEIDFLAALAESSERALAWELIGTPVRGST